MSEFQKTNPAEAQFITASGEVLDEQSYLHWELNDLLRYIHERSVCGSTHMDGMTGAGEVESPQGILANMALSLSGGMTSSQIQATMHVLDVDRAKAINSTLEALATAGLINKHEEEWLPDQPRITYSLAASGLDYYDALEARLQRMDQELQARKEDFRKTILGDY